MQDNLSHFNHFLSSVALVTFTMAYNHPTVYIQNFLIAPNRISVLVKL